MKEQLIIELIAEARDAVNEMKKYTDAAQKTAKKTGKVTALLKSYWGEALVAYAAVKKLWNIGKKLTDAYIEQENAQTKLNTALIATGRYTPEVAQEMSDFAGEFQNLTTFSDEAVLSAQGVMATFTKIGNETFPEAIEAAANMSALFGQDLQQSVVQLGTALNDPIQGVGRLRRIGISFSETQKAMIEKFVDQNDIMSAQRVILDELQVELGGMSKALGETFGGRIEKVKNLFGDLQEVLGGILAENAEPMINWLIDFLKNGENIETIARIVRGFGATFGTVFGFVIEVIKSVVAYVKIMIATFQTMDRVFSVVFNPKKWGMGELKSAFKDLGQYTADLAKDIGREWEEFALKTGDKWVQVFKGEVMPTIQTFSSDYQLEMGNIIDVTEDAKEAAEEYAEIMVYSGEQLDTYIMAMQSYHAQLERERELAGNQKDDMNAILELMDEQKDRLYDMSDGYQKFNNEVEENNELMERSENIASQFVIPAMREFEGVVYGLSDALKEFIKEALSNLLRALAEHLSIMAVFYALTLQFGKAAAAAAGAAAAYAAAGAITALAQGGQFVTEGPTPILVGDNPSGKERVTVEPLGGGAQTQSFPERVTLMVDGQPFKAWLRREVSSGNIPIYEGALTKNK